MFCFVQSYSEYIHKTYTMRKPFTVTAEGYMIYMKKYTKPVIEVIICRPGEELCALKPIQKKLDVKHNAPEANKK